ncbi:MAG: hypothetical protein K0S04_1038 [Herbinix sp.]|jgi:hypothetical protein|nr:hypothetical protein [Herbinix sp.]
MMTIYLCFLAGGAVLPLISFAFGFLGSGTDVDAGVDTSTDFNMDVDMDVDVDANLDAAIHSEVDPSTAIGVDGDPGQGVFSMLAVGLVPTSAMALSTLAIVFGAVGSIMTYKGVAGIITFLVAIVIGYAAAVIVQSFIRTLKRIQVENTGVDEKELILYDGTVVDTILPGQLGSVSFLTLKNIRVSYPARCIDEEMRLPTGRVVRVIEIKNGIFIVEPKNKYE